MIVHGCENGNFHDAKKNDVFLFFDKNINCGYMLERLIEAVLSSTNNLCFSTEIRKKNVYPYKPQFY